MRVFVTGASGWIGSAVVPELLDAGHQVTGLARSEASAAAITAAGAQVVRGDLDDAELLRRSAEESDGVIHLAFKHDQAFSGGFEAAALADRQVVELFGEVLAGSDRPLVLASGVLGVAPGRTATEADGREAAQGGGAVGIRQATAQYTLGLAERGVRSTVLRLPPTTHGDGDNGFMAMIVNIAREKGVSAYVGDGSNRWPAGHRLDAAHLFRLAVEKAPAGTVLHAVAEEGVPIKSVAEVIGRHLGLPVRSITAEEAQPHFGFLGHLIALDSPAASELTRELLDWRPTQPGLLEDLDKGHYFR